MYKVKTKKRRDEKAFTHYPKEIKLNTRGIVFSKKNNLIKLQLLQYKQMINILKLLLNI